MINLKAIATTLETLDIAAAIKEQLQPYEMVSVSYSFLRANLDLFQQLLPTLRLMHKHPLIVFSSYMRSPVGIKKFVGKNLNLVVCKNQLITPVALMREFLIQKSPANIWTLAPEEVQLRCELFEYSPYADRRYWEKSMEGQHQIFSGSSKIPSKIDFVIFNCDDLQKTYSMEDIQQFKQLLQQNPHVSILCSSLIKAKKLLNTWVKNLSNPVISFGSDSYAYWKYYQNKNLENLKQGSIVWLGNNDHMLPAELPLMRLLIESD